jgi:Na+/melibiose symporter-like transporter
VIGIVGAVCLVSTVSWLGKRFLSLVSLAGNAASCLLLGIYSYVVLRPDGAEQLSATWLPLSLIIVFSFCSSVMFEIPWMMLSEVFPFRYGQHLPRRQQCHHAGFKTCTVTRLGKSTAAVGHRAET